MAQRRMRTVSSWIDEVKREREVEEDLLACRLIVLKIVRYMKDNHLSQKELAERLNVSPQYINKFLHGQDLDMKVSTVLRYGRILGIKLLEVPGQIQTDAVYISYSTMKRINNIVQPASFEYLGSFHDMPSFKSSVRKWVSCSNHPVS